MAKGHSFGARHNTKVPMPRQAGAPQPPIERFPRLAELITYLSGLKKRADLKVLDRLLREVKITRADIESACVFGNRGYRRNTIAAGTWFELLALTWRSGHCTPIHDHQGVSCAFRVIQGTGTEIRFVRTPSDLICPVQTTIMKEGFVCSAEENEIHQIANMQGPEQELVTLHIYSPRITKMNTYHYKVSLGAELDEGPSVYRAPKIRRVGRPRKDEFLIDGQPI